MDRAAIARPAAGTLIAAVTGAWCAYLVLMPASALIVWPVSAAVESASAGAAAAWILAARRPWRRLGWVFGSAVLLFVLGVLTQNLFFSKIH